MRLFISILLLIAGTGLQAQEKMSDPEAVRKDIRMICELSKLGKALLSSPEFKDDKATVAFRVSELVQATVKTPEAKSAVHGKGEADSKSKQEMWRKLAEQAGIKNWNCPTIGITGG